MSAPPSHMLFTRLSFYRLYVLRLACGYCLLRCSSVYWSDLRMGVFVLFRCCYRLISFFYCPFRMCKLEMYLSLNLWYLWVVLTYASVACIWNCGRFMTILLLLFNDWFWYLFVLYVSLLGTYITIGFALVMFLVWSVVVMLLLGFVVSFLNCGIFGWVCVYDIFVCTCEYGIYGWVSFVIVMFPLYCN